LTDLLGLFVPAAERPCLFFLSLFLKKRSEPFPISAALSARPLRSLREKKNHRRQKRTPFFEKQ